MKEGFRQSMAWLHTWTGLLAGWILFLIFAAGTASYYKDEITFWMKPELHNASRELPTDAVSTERAIAFLQQRAPASPRWTITLPSAREPVTAVTWTAPAAKPGADTTAAPPRRARTESAHLDPATGQPLATPRATRGGEFFYRLHFDLHYLPQPWGRWIVVICAMFMLVAIVSGVITHRRIFADFFTFRPKKGQRSWLDAHNAAAVFALPFHLMITYTGLVTVMFIYLPWGQQAVYKGGIDNFFAEVFPVSSPRPPKPAGLPTSLAPLAPMVTQAHERWHGSAVNQLIVNNPNDAKATVGLQRREGRDMASTQPTMLFDGVTGKLLSTKGDTLCVAGETRSVTYGLHLGRFANPLLRFFFFLSGLAGCLMVATGLVMWAVKERQTYAKTLARGGRVGFGLRLVDGLNIGAVCGVPIAIAVYFWANRLLPVTMSARPDAEIAWFFTGLGLSMAAALAWPTRRMWQWQLFAGGVLFAGVPVVNALTTSSHLGRSLMNGWGSLAGVDLTCLGLGVALTVSAAWLGRKKQKPSAKHARNTSSEVPA